mgnify:FL=1
MGGREKYTLDDDDDDSSIRTPRTDPTRGVLDSNKGVTGIDNVLFADKGMTMWVQKKDPDDCREILLPFCDCTEPGV